MNKKLINSLIFIVIPIIVLLIITGIIVSSKYKYILSNMTKENVINSNNINNDNNDTKKEEIKLDSKSLIMNENQEKILTYDLSTNLDTPVKWESSNPEVVTVTNGVITSLKEGTANITVITSDGKKDVLKVSVVKTMPKSVTLNKSSITLEINGTDTLIATVLPKDSYSKKVTFSTSNNKVVTVDKNGNVKGVKAGTATITAKAVSGASATVNVKVINKSIPVKSISLKTINNALVVGESKNSEVIFNPRNVTNRKITWESSNINVASVDSKGIIKAIGPGDCIISATSVNGKTASISIKVVNKSIKVIFHRNASSNDTETFIQSFTIGDNSNRFGYSNGKAMWSDSNQFCEWEKNHYRMIGWALTSDANNNNYEVYNIVKDSWIEKIYNQKYTTQKKAKEIDLYAVWEKIPLKKITITSGDTLQISPNETQKISIGFSPSNAYIGTVQWSSSDSSIATVDKNGNVKGVKAGTAIITVNASGIISRIQVNVVKKIKVIFHRNTSSSDNFIAEQEFIIGASGNKFGYNTDGTYKWGNSGQFGKWDYAGHTLKGWSKTSNGGTSYDYRVYSDVSDTWLKNVEKDYNSEIHLYAVWYENVDLILFFGQSNMVGYVGDYSGEQNRDTRSIKGVDNDLVSLYRNGTYGYIGIPIPNGVGYEFNATPGTNTGTLIPITKDTRNIGQNITYQNGVFTVKPQTTTYSLKANNALQKSSGTNMIPEFIREYNSLTGHKVVAVHAARGGQAIVSFQKGYSTSNSGSLADFDIYETLVAKYKAAETYLKSNKYEIKNKFYIVYQGCSDINNTANYYNQYKKVHDDIISDLNLDFGAMVYVGYDFNSNKDISSFNRVQVNTVNSIPNLIEGTDFVYRQYTSGNDTIASNQQKPNGSLNSIHLTSLGLSQVGRNVAKSVSSSGRIK